MWDWKKWIVFSLPFVLVVLGAVAWFLLRKTIRTRFRMAHQLRGDPDVNEWLVVFDWSRKVVYAPTIIASLLAALLMWFQEMGWLSSLKPEVVGGVWLAVFFVNFLIDEYDVTLKFLLVALLVFIILFLWLLYLEWVSDFFSFFRHLGIRVNSTGYLILALVFLLAVVISWLRGLFYYVTITPNYLGIQTGPTETGEQVSREDYNTRIDTSDFMERMLGFGRIVVSFRDQRRQPLTVLVSGIGKKAERLEAIRATLAIERGPKDASVDSEGVKT